jgi:hypothetical protein
MSVHDDPVVVDNGPIRIDFGAHGIERKADGEKDTYVRPLTAFRFLVAAVVDRNGLRERPRVHPLGRVLVTSLGRSLGKSLGVLEVTTEKQWGFQLTEGRLLEARIGAPRIVDIVHRGQSLTPFPLRDVDPTKRVVLVTLIPGLPLRLARDAKGRAGLSIRKRGK